MKKSNIIKIVGAAAAILVFGVIIATSFMGRGTYELVLNKLSEERHDLMTGENEFVKVSFMTGKRESDYLTNGYHTSAIDYGVVTFIVDDNLVKSLKAPQYALTVGMKKYSGVLEKSPIDGSYVADILKLVDTSENIIAKIFEGDFVHEVPLATVMEDWALNHKGALKLACKELSKELDTFIINKEFAGEAYVRTINNKDFNEKDYYWYVSFVNREGRTVAVIINPKTREIMAKQSVVN